MKLIIASLLLVAVTGQYTDKTYNNNNSTEDRYIQLTDYEQNNLIKLTLFNLATQATNPEGVVIWPNPPTGFDFATLRYKPLKVFVHGFFSKAKKVKNKGFATEFLDSRRDDGGDVNVILVSWRKLAKGQTGINAPLKPQYVSAAKYAMDVGEFLAIWLLNNICLATSATPNGDIFHLIGHSLGAQAVGNAGRIMRNYRCTPKRVTGLDPAGPFFDFGWHKGLMGGSLGGGQRYPIGNEWTFNSLSEHIPGLIPIGRDSGEFVDIIHSNTGSMGARRPLGHVDFYANGGLRIQKCFWKWGNTLPGDKGSHSMATELFISTINNPQKFPSLPCYAPNYDVNTNNYPICSRLPAGRYYQNYLGMGAVPSQPGAWSTDVSICTGGDPNELGGF